MVKPAAPYFLIRILKKEQSEKKGKIGSIIIPETVAFMQYNVQAGEIIGIGERAASYFPEAKIGDTLLCHHFVEGENSHDARTNHLVDEDDLYRYYVVSCFEIPGKGNETYGVWDGEKIIPNKDYIFLEPEIKTDNIAGFNDLSNLEKVSSVTTSGIIVFNEWKENRENKVEKMKRLKSEIESLSKSDPNKPHIKNGIKYKEEELQRLSLDINEKKYLPYTIAYFNESLQDSFDYPIEQGDTIYCLNIACETHIDFNGSKYRVVKTNYIGILYRSPAILLAS